MNTSLNRTGVIYLRNKSGVTLAYGAVAIVDPSNLAAITTTTQEGYSEGMAVVVIEPAGIVDEAIGLCAYAGPVPQINLNASASNGDLVRCSTDAGEGVPHAASMLVGDFAQVIGTGSTPAAILFGTTVQLSGSGQYFAPTGLTGATQASRYVGATSSGAPVTGTFEIGDWVAARNGVFWMCTVAGSPGTWVNIGGGSGAASVYALAMQGANVTVANTVTETDLLPATEVPADSMNANAKLRIQMMLTVTHNTAGNLTIRIKLGATTLASIVIPAGVSSPSKPGFIEAFIANQNSQSSQKTIAQAFLQDGSGNVIAWGDGTSSIDLSTAEDLSVTAQWSSASASLTMTLHHISVEILNL